MVDSVETGSKVLITAHDVLTAIGQFAVNIHIHVAQTVVHHHRDIMPVAVEIKVFLVIFLCSFVVAEVAKHIVGIVTNLCTVFILIKTLPEAVWIAIASYVEHTLIFPTIVFTIDISRIMPWSREIKHGSVVVRQSRINSYPAVHPEAYCSCASFFNLRESALFQHCAHIVQITGTVVELSLGDILEIIAEYCIV